MATPRKNHFVSGQKFGRLVLQNSNGQMWYCLCECGEYKTARATDIATGRVKSCGCLERENRIRHNKNQSDISRRLNNSVVKDNGCIEFCGYRNACGYGVLRISGKSTLAHRAAYELLIGKIPAGMQVNHTCDNPACINPSHLWIGTQIENVIDCIKKGRHRPFGRIPKLQNKIFSKGKECSSD